MNKIEIVTSVVSGIVTTNPSLLHWLLMTVNSAGVGQLTLTDGQDDIGRQVLITRCLGDTSFFAKFDPPIPCNNGLFATLSTNCDNANFGLELLEQT